MRPSFSTKIVQNVLFVSLVNDAVNAIVIWVLGGLVEVWIGLVTMKAVMLLTAVYYIHCQSHIFSFGEGAVVTERDVPVSPGRVNDRPIVGILAQEQSYQLKDKYQEDYSSYIAASYVKSVEAAGARVVPIMIGKDRDYYRHIISKINGVLLPGGNTWFNQSNGYADAGQYIYEIAQDLNKNDDYFPIFGTCLGFELLIILASGRGEKENRITCRSRSNMPLHFVKDYRESKMFKNAPKDILCLLSNENITINNHQFCIVDENLNSHNLTKDWRVNSYSDDDNGLEFISSIEHKRYPFYGVQFHPEKVAYEWGSSKHIHSFNAVKANRYFMDSFVNECRKNSHKFANATEENEYLIYNFAPRFTGLHVTSFEQCYFFEPKATDKNLL